ncbi:hypothetical protein [Aminobacter ciceronei]|uniref:Uncharacterized protein n=1 Tax=Aminobacter ciceronei TaxID=150723 RepID=A0ABR6BZM4_9HYPH|nr:hypothetical protein [Aminobacter ciceronei]MBA8904390.1 hypothetical protein [Aminobacter ciceronei]MBA9018168.1 hypothetical protein [Aminobacter ciceronei]MRX33244.1 hypothetical protein [Aminobacter sp. MDW-2]
MVRRQIHLEHAARTEAIRIVTLRAKASGYLQAHGLSGRARSGQGADRA